MHSSRHVPSHTCTLYSYIDIKNYDCIFIYFARHGQLLTAGIYSLQCTVVITADLRGSGLAAQSKRNCKLKITSFNNKLAAPTTFQ